MELQNYQNVNDFYDSVAQIIEQARKFVGRTADLTMCVTYFEVGRMIVEREQEGKERAAYGKGLLKGLSAYLNDRIGKGFSESTLRNARKFYQIYEPSIQQAMLTESAGERQTPSLFKIKIFNPEKQQAMLAELYPFKLSWTHYLILMRIDREEERRFYEIETLNQHWTYRQLQRQYGSSLYERLALSRDKDEVLRLSTEGQAMEKSRDMLKNPLVLEFLGMDEKAEYSENDLETAIINKLQTFLLELGKGFLFEARQNDLHSTKIISWSILSSITGCYNVMC